MSDKDSTNNNRFRIDRPVYQDNTIDETFNERKQTDPNFQSSSFDLTKEKRTSKYKRKVLEKLNKNVTKCQPKSCLLTTFPCLEWLSTYHWREDLVKDAIAGFTVAVMNIPQGMGYALLGNVPPVVGLYMAIFPAIVYAVFGTSRHCAMGTFAVISLMSGKVVSTYAIMEEPLMANSTVVSSTIQPQYKPVEVGSAICFLVGVYQLIMYVLRLGKFSSFLSDTLVSGLTSGAAVHVFTSQIKDLLGIKIKTSTGNFQLIKTYITIFSNLGTINIGACVVSLVTITILIINIKYLKPWVSKRSVVPVPVELIILLLGTAAAQFFQISERFNLTTVGPIAVGLPEFKGPPMALLPSIAVDSFVIAIVAYVISISMALLFAQKLHYEIEPNQELLAQGAGNFLGSFLSCLPFCTSLSRSVILEAAGGRTQLSSIFCAVILIGVLTTFARIFEPLPRAILAGLIIVALRGILCQVTGIFRVWKLSATDGMIWIVTYLTVIIVEVDIGLLVGIIFSNIMIYFQGVRPKIYALARLPNTEIYVDPERYSKIESISNVCIIHYSGNLNFTNQAYFKEQVYKIVDRYPKREIARKKTLSPKVKPIDMNTKQADYIILDLSAILNIDPSGANGLLTLAQEFAHVSVQILLAGTPGPVYDRLQKCGVIASHMFLLFPTIHDAVLFTESRQLQSNSTTKV